MQASDLPALGNYGNSYASPAQDPFFEPGFTEPELAPGASRRAALALRERLWSVSSIPDVRKCGRVPRGSLLALVEAPGGVRLTGLCRCHSVWVCPICAPEIRAARGSQIAGALSSRLASGGAASFGTGTLSHLKSHSLRSTYSLVVSAWAAVTQDRSVRSFRAAHGYGGFIRTTEVTHTRNGWHPHMHWLDFWDAPLSWGELKAYELVCWSAWARAVERMGDSRRASRRRGLLVLPVRAGEVRKISNYVTELGVQSASFELTAISTKSARRGGLSPFEILAKVYGPGSHPWVDLWWEYEKATRGRRMLGASRGLLRDLGLSESDPDPEDVDRSEVVAYVRAEDWSAIRWFTASGLAGAQAVLEAAAAGGQIAVDRAVALLLGLPVAELVLDEAAESQAEFDLDRFGGSF